MAEIGTEGQEQAPLEGQQQGSQTQEGEQTAVEQTEEQKKEAEAAAAAENVSEEEKKKRREGFERRQEKKRLRELELENARLQGFREGLEKSGARTEETTAPATVSKPVRPKEADFPTHEEYEAALDKYEDQRDEWRDRKKLEEHRTTETKTAAERAQRELDETIVKHVNEGRKKYDDFDEVVIENDDLKTTPLMVTAIAKRPNAPDIQYYLGKNPAESLRLAKISDPIELIAEIGEISATLKAKAASSAPPTNKTTKAPTPPSTVQGKANPSTSVSLEGKTQAERIALIEEAARKKRLQRR